MVLIISSYGVVSLGSVRDVRWNMLLSCSFQIDRHRFYVLHCICYDAFSCFYLFFLYNSCS